MIRGHILFLGVLVLFAAVNVVLVARGTLALDWDGVGVICGAALTLALYSFLYKDNPLFKLAEHIFVGVTAAYIFGQYWFQSFWGDLLAPLTGEANGESGLLLLVPTALGVLMLMRFSARWGWTSRLAFAFFVGLGAGFTIPRSISSYILGQLGPTLAPLSWSAEGFDLAVILVGVVSVLVYFFFSVEHTGAVGAVSRVGVWFLMVAFGASFGYTVMARISLLIGRVSFLLGDWLHVMD